MSNYTKPSVQKESLAYEKIFNQRGALYNRATHLCPRARATERRLLIEMLDLRPGCTVYDAPAGGGYLADGIAALPGNSARVVCVDPSPAFARGIGGRFEKVVSSLERLGVASESADRVGSLAGLHHLASKLDFLREAHRILKPGGRFAAADVRAGSAAALFLNDVVNRLSETGHDGVFLEEGELATLLRRAGFVEIIEQYHEYSWDFPDEHTLLKYFRDLFGLTKASLEEIRTEITQGLPVHIDGDGAHVTWSLVYAAGNKH